MATKKTAKKAAKKTVKIPRSVVKTREEVADLGVDVDKVEAEAERADAVAVVVDDKCTECNGSGLFSREALCPACGGTGRI